MGRIDVATRLIVAPSKAEEAGAEKLVAGTCQPLFVERTTPRCPDLARLRSAPYYALPVLSEPCARVRLTSQPLNSERGDDPWKEDDLPCQDSQNNGIARAARTALVSIRLGLPSTMTASVAHLLLRT